VPSKKKRIRNRSIAAEIAAKINSGMGSPVMRLASDPELEVVKIPTPSLTINRVTGGGFALGRHVEMFGDPNSGKSLIAYGTMAMSQQRGNVCALVDPEGVFDPDWFTHLGGYPDELLYERPENAEEVIGVIRMLAERAREGDPIEVVTVDSVAALVTKEQEDKDPRDEERIASQARMMSRALRLITTKNKRVLFLWTNQERSNIGFGSQFQPRTQSGGRALGYYATTRLEFKKTGRVDKPGRRAEKMKLESKKIKVGDWIQVRAEKEKSTRPYMQGAYIYRADRGEIDLVSEIIQLGLEDEIINRKGNRFEYEGIDGSEVIGFESDFRETLEGDEDLRDEIIMCIEDMTHQLSRVESNGTG
jgi:recombination protein RecA